MTTITGTQDALLRIQQVADRLSENRNAWNSVGVDGNAIDNMVTHLACAIDEMKTTLNRNFDALMAAARAGKDIDLDDRLLYRHQSAQVVDRCAQLITRVFYASGADGIYLDRPLGRTFVDIHCGRTHVANNFAKTGRNMGAVMLGKPNADTFI